MAKTNWAKAVSGNFATAKFWSNGVPKAAVDAVIGVAGTYTITVNSSVSAKSILLDAAKAKFDETTKGSIHLTGAFHVADGMAHFGGKNSFGSIKIDGNGHLTFDKAPSLGSGSIALGGNGSLTATTNAVVANAITTSGLPTIAVTKGASVQSTGTLTIATTGTTHLNFHGDNSGGNLELAGKNNAANATGKYYLDILGEQLTLGTKAGATLLNDAKAVTVEKTGILNLNDPFSGYALNLVIKDDGKVSLNNDDTHLQTFAPSLTGKGSLQISGSGTTEIGGNNTYTGTTSVTDGTVVLDSANALGKGAVSLSDTHVELASNTSKQLVHIDKDVFVRSGSGEFHGALTCQWFLDVAKASAATFGEDPGPPGTARAPAPPAVLIMNLSGFTSADSSYTIRVVDITIKSTVVNQSAFDAMLNGAQSVTVDTDGVLDLTKQDNITLHHLSGDGQILNTGAHEHLTVAVTQAPANFTGDITGDFDLTTTTAVFTGASMSLAAGDTIYMAGSFGSLAINGVDFSGGAAPNIDMGTGSTQTLVIDHQFGGTIGSFGNNDGITVADESFDAGSATLHFVDNGSHTGGVLTVTVGSQAAIVLDLEGDYLESDFQVVASLGRSVRIVSSATFNAMAHDLDATVLALHHIHDAMV